MDKEFGAYELKERIGKGGMAWVYLANQKNLDRLVALKILFPNLAEDEHLVERFKLEARSAAAMRHENIAQVYDFGSHGEQFYIAMEYVEGLNLRDWIDRNGTPPIEIALLLLRDICRGLEHAHRRNIIHRDIKPSNVMFTPEGVIKLMDFGLARRVEDRSGITMHGAMLGTPAYMSPEQARGEKLDQPTTDIFSFGIVCYEMLGGLKPFQGDSSSVARAILYEEPRPLDALDPLVPPTVEAMIRRMLEKNANVRVQTATEVRQAFDQSIAELGIAHDRELLADFAADPVRVGGVLRAKRLAWHLERVSAAEARGDAMALLREHRCVSFLDPTNPASAEYVKAHDVPEPLRRPFAHLDIEQTMLVTPEERAASRLPASPDAPTLPPRAASAPPSAPPAAPVSAAPPSVPPVPAAPPPAPFDMELTMMAPAPPPATFDAGATAIAPPTPPPAAFDAGATAVAPAAAVPPRPAAPRPAPPAPKAAPPKSAPPPRPPAPPAAAPKPKGGGSPMGLWIGVAAAVVVIAVVAFFLVRRPAAPPATNAVPEPPAEMTDVPVPDDGVPLDAAAATASLTVQAEPLGALVFVDKLPSRLAPARFDSLAPASHTVRVMRDSFQTVRRVFTLAAGLDTTISVRLKPAALARFVDVLRVNVTPDDAEVVLDGEPARRGSATFLKVAAGEHTLEVRREGYATAHQQLSLGARPETTLAIALRPGGRAGAVTVRTSPGGGQVSLDGGPAQREPARFEGVRFGEHRVRATLSGKGEAEAAFAFSGARDTTFTLKLAKPKPVSGATAILSLWMRPAGTIFIDRVPKYFDVESVTVVVEAGRDYHVGFQANWSKEYASRTVKPLAGQTRMLGYDFRTSELARVDIAIQGAPATVEILIDGKRSGVKAPGTIYVGPGSHKIDVALDGWKSAEGQQTIKFKGGQQRSLTFNMARL